MKGTSFKESNITMNPPEGQEDRVYPLPVWAHPEGGMFISKWKMNWKDRIKALIFGAVWLNILSQQHPPVGISTDYPFEREVVPLGRVIRWLIILAGVLLTLAIGGLVFRLNLAGVL